MFANRLTQESRIKVQLLGGKVDSPELREAVEFFLEGPGRSMPRPCSRGEWEQLLHLTGFRKPPLLPILPSDMEGEFLPC